MACGMRSKNPMTNTSRLEILQMKQPAALCMTGIFDAAERQVKRLTTAAMTSPKRAM